MRTVFGFLPIIFWIVHIILFIVAIKGVKRPGLMFFLIPGAAYSVFDIRWEFFHGGIHYPIILIIIEVILMIIGAIILTEGLTLKEGIVGIIMSFLQGYVFGIIGIVVLTTLGVGLMLSIILMILGIIGVVYLFS
jgi:hypothetical protein